MILCCYQAFYSIKYPAVSIYTMEYPDNSVWGNVSIYIFALDNSISSFWNGFNLEIKLLEIVSSII